MTTETAIAMVDDGPAALALGTVDPLDNLMRYANAIEVSYGFAEKICRTAIVPKIYQGKPQDAAVAILHGAELGLNPLAALQNVFPVHGMPSIYAKTMVALLKSKGYKFKTVEAGPEKVTFTGWWPGEDPETSTWTIERATKAGFVPTIDEKTGEFARNKWDKLIGNEKYLLQPEEMLWAKAAATVCKRLAPHILLGLAVAEDQEDRADEPEPVRVASERVTPLAPETGVAAGPLVQQWQPPADEQTVDEPASQEGAKPDTAQVEEPPAKPAKASTSTQQKKVARLLDERGIAAAADKLGTLSSFFGRPFASSAEMTWDEAVALLAHLEDNPVATEQQVERLGKALDEVGLTDKVPADRLEFVSLKTERPIADLKHLTGTEAETLAGALENSIPCGPTGDETPAGDVQ
ncbi:hypothetical protein [Nocardia sp. NPDC058633]|uniref:hypothetical protein n=1 Tax=Nocardia sp. NPDC058633 TaxID=3346568 RepID=UPI00366A0807